MGLKNDDLLEIMRRRRSVRHYGNADKVTSEELLKLIEAARWAPSANNRQLWKFISVTQKEMLQNIASETEKVINSLLCRDTQLKTAYGQPPNLHNLLFFKEAPLVIFVLVRRTQGYLETDPDNAGLSRQSAFLAVGAAIQNLLLVAETMNLHTCWMTGPLLARNRIEAILGVTAPWELVSMVPVGKGMETPVCADIRRKSIQKIWERYEDAATN
jgi:nitroreductase